MMDVGAGAVTLAHISTPFLHPVAPESHTPMSRQRIMLRDIPGGVSHVEQEQHGLISSDVRFIINLTHSPPFRHSFHQRG